MSRLAWFRETISPIAIAQLRQPFDRQAMSVFFAFEVLFRQMRGQSFTSPEGK
jgi:hypothetical protein